MSGRDFDGLKRVAFSMEFAYCSLQHSGVYEMGTGYGGQGSHCL